MSRFVSRCFSSAASVLGKRRRDDDIGDHDGMSVSANFWIFGFNMSVVKTRPAAAAASPEPVSTPMSTPTSTPTKSRVARRLQLTNVPKTPKPEPKQPQQPPQPEIPKPTTTKDNVPKLPPKPTVTAFSAPADGNIHQISALLNTQLRQTIDNIISPQFQQSITFLDTTHEQWTGLPFTKGLLYSAINDQVKTFSTIPSLPSFAALSTDQWVNDFLFSLGPSTISSSIHRIDRELIQKELAVASCKLYNPQAQPNDQHSADLYLFHDFHPNGNDDNKKALAISYVNRCIEVIMFWDKDLTPNTTHIPASDFNLHNSLSPDHDFWLAVYCSMDRPIAAVSKHIVAAQKHTKLYTIIGLALTAIRRAQQQQNTRSLELLFKFLFLLIVEHVVRPQYSEFTFDFKSIFDLE